MIDNPQFIRREPLSYRQNSLWLLDQLNQLSDYRVRRIVFDLEGEIDVERLRRSLQALVDQHEALRTVIRDDNSGGEVVQCVHSTVHVTLNLIAQDSLNGERSEEHFERTLDRLSRRASNEFKNHPLHAHLVSSASNDHRLVVLVDRLVFDWASRQILANELAALYASTVQNYSDTGSAGRNHTNLIDYVHWQKRLVATEAFQAHIDSTCQQLAGLPQVHGITLDAPRPVMRDYKLSQMDQALGAEKTQALYQLARDHNSDSYTLLYCVFATTVGRWSGENDLVIGARRPGRASSNFNACIGQLTETLVSRLSLSLDTSFSSLLTQAKERLSSIKQEAPVVPTEVVVEALRPERSLSYAPLCQLEFCLDDAEKTMYDGSDLSFVLNDEQPMNPNVELGLYIKKTEEGLQLDWRFAKNLFSDVTVNNMMQSFECVLDDILESTEKRVHALNVLPQPSLQKLIEWNTTQVIPEEHESLTAKLEKTVKSLPDRVAVKHDNQHLTYRMLGQRSQQLADRLSRSGVTAGDRVGLCCSPSVELVVGMFALLKTDSVYVPLDPLFPVTRLNYVIEEAQLSAVLVQAKHLELIHDRAVSTLVIEQTFLAHELTSGSETVSDSKPSSSSDRSDRYIIYTSGSTGRPKGVVGTHRSIINRLQWLQNVWPVSNEEIMCFKTPISFVDHIAEILHPLVYGCRLVVADQYSKAGLNSFSELIHHEKITRLTLTPSLLRSILTSTQSHKLQRIRYIISSGEALSGSTVHECRRLLPNARLMNLYGSTESGADSTYFEVDDYQFFNVMKYFTSSLQDEYFDRVSLGFSDVEQKGATLEHLTSMYRSADIPERPVPLDYYLSNLKETIVPGAVKVSSETYIGHMTSALPNFTPELSKLISHLNQNVVKVETSRSTTFIERQVLAIMHKLFFALADSHYARHSQDPHHMFGVVTSGGSVSNLTALWCARNKALLQAGSDRQALVEQGAHKVAAMLGFAGGVIIGSRLMHYSMRKICSLLGIGENSLRFVPQKDDQKISMEDLERTINTCQERGEYVIALVGVAGATETGTIDPLEEIAEIAHKYDIHFHVDAAWGGAFQFSDQYRHKLYGIEYADSVTLCSHKQLYLPQGMSLCLFRDSTSAKNISVHASYQANEGSFDLGQFTVEGSRPANSLLLHASLNLLSIKGYAWLIEQSVDKARYFEQLIRSTPCFELVGDPEINIVNYRFVPGSIRAADGVRYTKSQNEQIDSAVRTIQEAQFAQGRTFVSKTKILHKATADEPIWVFRVVLSNPLTRLTDLETVLRDQLLIATEVLDDQFDYSDIPVRAPQTYNEEKDAHDHRVIAIGKPIANTQVLVLDAQQNIAPIGAPGLLYIAGEGLAEGYLNDIDLTREKFVVLDHEGFKGKRFYSTGDLGRWLSNGNLEFLGRIDNQVKLRGSRIELEEVEHVLNDLDVIRESVVLLDRHGADRQYLTAYVVSEEQVSDSLEQKIFQELSETLPHFMLPARINFVPELPKTMNGKLDRNKMARIAKSNIKTIPSIKPRTRHEVDICRLWSTVLNVSETSIGIDDNFFEFGGDSLSAIRIAGQAQEYDLSFSVTELFTHQTVRKLAALQQRRDSSRPTVASSYL